jgi:hypothetical protein
MKIYMGRTGNQNEIIRGIVKFIPIRMMDDLGSEQRPAQFKRHDVPMFQNPFTFDSNHPVSLSSNSPFTICRLFADIGVSMADKPQIMPVAKPMSLDRGPSADRTSVRLGMFNEFASFGVFQNSVHAPSFSTNIPLIEMVVKRDGGENGVNSGEALTDGAEGNPEPSREYTPGRCNDYWRGKAPLITSLSAPLERDEIVYSLWKHEVCRYTTDIDGVGMEKPAARGANGVGPAAIAGVVAESIAAGAYGLVQVYGYHSAVRIKSSTTNTGAVAKGTALCGCVTAYYALENVPDTGTLANCYCKGFAFAAQPLYTTTATAAFILCL